MNPRNQVTSQRILTQPEWEAIIEFTQLRSISPVGMDNQNDVTPDVKYRLPGSAEQRRVFLPDADARRLTVKIVSKWLMFNTSPVLQQNWRSGCLRIANRCRVCSWKLRLKVVDIYWHYSLFPVIRKHGMYLKQLHRDFGSLIISIKLPIFFSHLEYWSSKNKKRLMFFYDGCTL